MSVNTVANGELVQVAGNAYGIVDDELNTESTRPVQNKIIAQEINDIKSALALLQAVAEEFELMKEHIIVDDSYEEETEEVNPNE